MAHKIILVEAKNIERSVLQHVDFAVKELGQLEGKTIYQVTKDRRAEEHGGIQHQLLTYEQLVREVIKLRLQDSSWNDDPRPIGSQGGSMSPEDYDRGRALLDARDPPSGGGGTSPYAGMSYGAPPSPGDSR